MHFWVVVSFSDTPLKRNLHFLHEPGFESHRCLLDLRRKKFPFLLPMLFNLMFLKYLDDGKSEESGSVSVSSSSFVSSAVSVPCSMSKH